MWKAIIRWIESKTIEPCNHEWEEINVSEVYNTDECKLPMYKSFVYACKKCKESKIIRTDGK